MRKIGWQNGTLISKAKVTIDGTVYEVEPEEYDGQTPLSAENFIQMENNVEDAIGVVDDRITGTILYNSESGTSSDISFTEDLDNYRILKIEYFEESGNSTSVSEIPVIFNKLFTLMNFYAGANAYLFVAKIRLENRKIAFDSNIRCILSGGTIETNKKIFISKIIGYK